jgi:hypothetical protein
MPVILFFVDDGRGRNDKRAFILKPRILPFGYLHAHP